MTIRYLRLIVAALAVAPTDTPALSLVAASAPSSRFVTVAAPRHPQVPNYQASSRADDPRLINRLVEFDGGSATFDGDAKACDRITKSSTRVALGPLLGHLFPDQGKYGRYIARPADYGLSLAPSAVVTATRFRCLTPRGNRGTRWTGATLFPIGGGRWALALVNDHLLILKPDTGPIRASFDCARARSTVERTICGDRLLAGWDRSVAVAYREGNDDAEGQRAWLKLRDECGNDKSCLHESMRLRADNLLR